MCISSSMPRSTSCARVAPCGGSRQEDNGDRGVPVGQVSGVSTVPPPPMPFSRFLYNDWGLPASVSQRTANRCT